ncbi:unnamed protein product [Prunus armeniaca]
MDSPKPFQIPPYLFFITLQMGWAAVRSELMKLSPVLKFRNQAPRMLRKDSRALGNNLITFINKNNNSLQMNS